MAWKNSALVLGVGPVNGLGATLANFFANKGLHVFIAGRSEGKLQQVAEYISRNGGELTVVVADATLEEDVNHLFDVIRYENARLTIAVYNVDSFYASEFLNVETEVFTDLWTQNCLGAFLFAQQAIRLMQHNHQGSIFFTGATASRRATPPFTAFASAKFALRALAQGLSKEFSAEGIHVVHVVIDGIIDGLRAEQQFPDYFHSKTEEQRLQLVAIAETYWSVHCQHASAWTHELDLKPYADV